METLAKELLKKITQICVEYHYFKKTDAIEKGKEMAEEIQQFTSGFLQGNIYGMTEEEYTGLKNYVLQVLKDYMEAVEQQDIVLMIDTLDYGLRELINIFIDEDVGEDGNE